MSQIENLHELLRGKSKQSGEWVYGDHTSFDMSGKQITDVYLVNGETHSPILYSTHGKCVGSTDKNEKLVFEDDKVKCKDGIGVVEWDDLASHFVIRFDSFTAEFDNYIFLGGEIEVVGNTFDKEYTKMKGAEYV